MRMPAHQRLWLASLVLSLGATIARTQPVPPALQTGEHEVVLNGVRLWYRIAGTPTSNTQPVLFLHGGPGYNSYSFAQIEGPLVEKSLRMIYLDQRGSG